jgi:hypothetical protein
VPRDLLLKHCLADSRTAAAITVHTCGYKYTHILINIYIHTHRHRHTHIHAYAYIYELDPLKVLQCYGNLTDVKRDLIMSKET